jgi:hypothetical protein
MDIVYSPGGIGGGNGPFWAGLQNGIFTRYGSSVTARRGKGGMVALARALREGEVHFSTLGASSMIHACLDGR